MTTSDRLQMRSTPSVQVAVRHGSVPDAAVERATRKIGSILRLAPAPVLFARVVLGTEASPCQERPASAAAFLDVNGRPLRAAVTAGTCAEAIDLLESKLRHRLEILAEHRQARRHEPAGVAPGSWRHGVRPAARPGWFPRPPEEREVVHHVSYADGEATLADAAADLDLLGQEWLLFTELTTGSDGLLERTDGGYRLTLDGGPAPDGADLGAGVEVHLEAPRADLGTALRLLDEMGVAQLFFVDQETGRGRVVYHRDDGHYGSVTAGHASSTASERRRS